MKYQSPAKKSLIFVLALSLLTQSFSLLFGARPAQAAQLTNAYLRLNRMEASTATGGVVCARMATNGTEGKIKVTFPSDFTVNGTAGNWTVGNSNLPTGSTDWSSSVTSPASGVSGQTVTWTLANGDYTGSLHCFSFSATTTLTTGSAGTDKTGTIQITTAADAEIDVSGYATAVLSDDNVIVTATVPPTFSMTISGSGAQALGTLSTGSVVSGAGNAVEFITNSANGWIGWLMSANAALNSTAASDTIATTGTVNGSPSTLSAGTEGYVADADLTEDSATGGSGTVTVNGEYNGADTSSGGTLSTSFTEFASADGPTDGDTITLIARAAISGMTQAATDYTDTWTIIGAGNF